MHLADNYELAISDGSPISVEEKEDKIALFVNTALETWTILQTEYPKDFTPQARDYFDDFSEQMYARHAAYAPLLQERFQQKQRAIPSLQASNIKRLLDKARSEVNLQSAYQYFEKAIGQLSKTKTPWALFNLYWEQGYHQYQKISHLLDSDSKKPPCLDDDKEVFKMQRLFCLICNLRHNLLVN